MSVEAGWQGVVKVGSDTVAPVRGWTLETNTEAVPVGGMGAQPETYIAGEETGTGTINVVLNDSDTGQGALSGVVTLDLYPQGEGTGKPRRQFQAVITSAGEEAQRQGAVMRNYAFQVSGAIDRTAQT